MKSILHIFLFAGSKNLFSLLISLFILFNVHCQYGLQFTGDNTWIRINSAPELALETFTLECWVMITGQGNSLKSSEYNERTFPIISKGIEESETGSFINYYLGLREADNVLMAEFESAESESVPGINYYIHGYTSLQPFEWYHIAATFDGSYLKIYLNGNLESFIECPYLPAVNTSSDVGLATSFLTDRSNTGQFIGILDEFRIWNYARSREQLIEFMNSELDISTSDPVIYLPFNEGSGSLITYDSLNNFDISLEGTSYNWQPGTDFSAMHVPQCSEEPNLRIGVMADPQYCDCDPKRTRYYRETLWKLPEAISDFNEADLDFVVTLGDVIDKYPESYDSVLPFYDELTVPDFKALGNHEFEEIPDEMKDTIIKILGMPHYYYDTVYGNYRFIFIDGTEMGLYSRYVHPEIADEADSLWNEIQGEPKAKSWNGGVGRIQRNWIESRIQLAKKLGQSVVLMGHHQIYPDSTIGNLWNDVQLTEIFEKYPNVLAYINGHNHWGDKGLKNGKQYFTHKGMVETENSNSYSVLEIYNDRFEFKGFGNQESISFKVRKQDSLNTSLLVTSNNLSYQTDSGDVVGEVNSSDGYLLNYFLEEPGSLNDNQFFNLKSDTLILNQDSLPAGRAEFVVALKSLSCGFDTITQNIKLEFDTIAFQVLKLIEDTVIYTGSEEFSFDFDVVISDKSENGLVYKTSTENTLIVESYFQNKNLMLVPNSFGSSWVSYEVQDLFSGQIVSDTFEVFVVDSTNTAPVTIQKIDTVVLNLNDPGRFMPWDSIFYDADNDSLIITCFYEQNEIASFSRIDSGFYVEPNSSGVLIIGFTADDNRGGVVSDSLYAYINAPPYLVELIPDTSIVLGATITYYLDNYFVDEEPLNYRMNVLGENVETTLFDDQLIVETFSIGESKLQIWADDPYQLYDSAQWNVSVKDENTNINFSTPYISGTDAFTLYPNPFSSEVIINFHELFTGNLQVSNSMGQVIFTDYIYEQESFSVHLAGYEAGVYLIHISSDEWVFSGLLIKNSQD